MQVEASLQLTLLLLPTLTSQLAPSRQETSAFSAATIVQLPLLLSQLIFASWPALMSQAEPSQSVAQLSPQVTSHTLLLSQLMSALSGRS